MADDNAQQFSEEDLSLVKADAPGDQSAATNTPAAEGAETGKTADPAAQTPADKPADKSTDGKSGTKTIAGGADAEAEDKAKDDAAAAAKAEKVDRNELTEDLRKMIAEHYAAGDKKVMQKELRRLEGIKDVKGLWGMYRELESKFTSGGLVKIPGKDAKPEEISAFAKALGWSEKPEEMMGQINLANGVTIGDADKPRLNGFLSAIHGATSAADMVSKATNWYYKEQEEAAAALDEADDTFRRESETALKEEWGPAFKRRTNALASIFATAPGGTDLKNPNSLFARLLGGRTSDNKVIGNDPEILRWLDSMRNEINPAASVVEDGQQGGLSIDAEIKQIEATMRSDRRTYNKDPKMQARYLQLLETRNKIQARA